MVEPLRKVSELGVTESSATRKDPAVDAKTTHTTRYDIDGFRATRKAPVVDAKTTDTTSWSEYPPHIDGFRDDDEKRSCGKPVWIFSILFVVMVGFAVGQQIYFHCQFSNLRDQIAKSDRKQMKAAKTSRSHQVSSFRSSPMRPIKQQQVSSWTLDVEKVKDDYAEMAQWTPKPLWISKFGPTGKFQGITVSDIEAGFIPEKRYPWVLVGSLAETGRDQTFDFWPLDDFVTKLGEAWKNTDKVYSIILSVPQKLKDWLLVHEIRNKPPCAKFKHSLPHLFTALVVPPGTLGGRLKPYDDMVHTLDGMVNKSRGKKSFVEKLIVSQETSMADFADCLLRLDQSYSVWPSEMPTESSSGLVDVRAIKAERDKWKVPEVLSSKVAMVGKIKYDRTKKTLEEIKLEEKNKDDFLADLNDASDPKNSPKTFPMIMLMRFDHDFVASVTEEFLEMEEQQNDINNLEDVIVTNCYYVSLVIPDAADEEEKLAIKSNFGQMTREIDRAAGPLVRVTWANVDDKLYDNIETLRRLANLISDYRSVKRTRYMKLGGKLLVKLAGTVGGTAGKAATR